MRPSRATITLLCALALAGCGAKKARKPAAAKPPDPVEPIRKLLASAYSALGRGEVDELASVFTLDVVAFGPAAADTLAGREPLAGELRRRLMPLGLSGGQLRVSSTAPRIGLAPGGRSAWLWDLPTLELLEEGKAPARYQVRLTAHLVHEQATWAADAVHLSVGLGDDELFKASAPERLGPPLPVASEHGPGSEPLLELLERVLEDPLVKIDRTSERDEVVLIGTGPSELFEGGRKFKEWARPMLPKLKKMVVKLKIDGPAVARLAPDGATGFVATTLRLTLGAGKKAKTLPPFRSLWVFLKEEGGWSVVEDHESSGVPQEMWKPDPVFP